ncbi:hypothetical protein LX70_02652 [Defluviimonas denitrificans]|jgi:hypothetical protein|uniref:Uncharacterized protein n=1 Tax=Albidovulum denitrificans TaxID=404881 RepID=A0A2S8S6G5_9RHOB|nr:hypothetical protein [Defluviimonas denitrificans]PQV56386.1 hypothetical protein LX70_02652 [Defluviimonas denitrificans]
MKKPIVVVSDHALVRYIERVLKIDVETLRREIGRRVDRGVEMGVTGVEVDGFIYKLQEGHVTTVLEASRPDLRCGRQRKERPE